MFALIKNFFATPKQGNSMSSIIRTVKIVDATIAAGFRIVELPELVTAVTAVLDGLASDVIVTIEDIAAQASAKLAADQIVSDAVTSQPAPVIATIDPALPAATVIPPIAEAPATSVIDPVAAASPLIADVPVAATTEPVVALVEPVPAQSPADLQAAQESAQNAARKAQAVAEAQAALLAAQEHQSQDATADTAAVVAAQAALDAASVA